MEDNWSCFTTYSNLPSVRTVDLSKFLFTFALCTFTKKEKLPFAASPYENLTKKVPSYYANDAAQLLHGLKLSALIVNFSFWKDQQVQEYNSNSMNLKPFCKTARLWTKNWKETLKEWKRSFPFCCRIRIFCVYYAKQRQPFLFIYIFIYLRSQPVFFLFSSIRLLFSFLSFYEYHDRKSFDSNRICRKNFLHKIIKFLSAGKVLQPPLFFMQKHY